MFFALDDHAIFLNSLLELFTAEIDAGEADGGLNGPTPMVGAFVVLNDNF